MNRPLSDMQRIARLGDSGTFEPLAPAEECGYVTGTIQIHGRLAVVVATATTISRDVDLLVSIEQYLRALAEAGRRHLPIVVLLDTPARVAGRRDQYTADPALLLMGPKGMGRVYREHACLAGKVPQVGVLCGPIIASLSFLVPLYDVTVMTEQASLCLGSPAMVREMLGEDTTLKRLGGAQMHFKRTGLADALVQSDSEALQWARRYLTFMPTHDSTWPPGSAAQVPGSEPPAPPDGTGPLADMPTVLGSLVDTGSFLELQAGHAREALTGMGRIAGHRVGIVASNPHWRGGILFPATCRKIERFVITCERFGLPLIFLADVPGLMIGTAAEESGIVAAGASLFAALARTTVPTLSIVVRKACTAGLYAMAGPALGHTQLLALPGAAISMFAPSFLQPIVQDSSRLPEERAGFLQMLAEAEDPGKLVARGLVGEVISPGNLRVRVVAALGMPRQPQGE